MELPSDIDQRTARMHVAAGKATQLFDAMSNVHMRACAGELLMRIELFMKHVPLITSLRHPGMRERHWGAINSGIAAAVMGSKRTHNDAPKQGMHPLFFSPDAPTSLSALLSSGASDYEAIIFDVCQAAAKEHAVEVQLDNLVSVWKSTRFDVAPHASSGSYFLRGIPELMITLDEHLTITQTLLAVQHNSQHAASIAKWMKTFSHAADVLVEFTDVQSQWLQLGPLLQSPELMEALPAEVKLFNTIDKLYKRLILSVRRGRMPFANYFSYVRYCQKLCVAICSLQYFI